MDDDDLLGEYQPFFIKEFEEIHAGSPVSGGNGLFSGCTAHHKCSHFFALYVINRTLLQKVRSGTYLLDGFDLIDDSI